MGAVFTSAARAPLTSLASVVEMTGDFSLTLPVMLAVAIATMVSRALSYGTIYTTKLLRRGTDIDQAAPWRALADLTITDVMRPFAPALPVPPDPAAAPAARTLPNGNGSSPDRVVVDGPLADRHGPQALFTSESLAQTLRQLEVYGRDGLPVLSPDGRHVEGWITSAAVLRALARQITGTPAVDGDHDDEAEGALRHPPVPLAGYEVAEITITAGSPAAGRKLGEVTWPQAGIPVSLLRARRHGPPDPGAALAEGDRVGLLIPVTPAPGRPDPAGRPQGLSVADARGDG